MGQYKHAFVGGGHMFGYGRNTTGPYLESYRDSLEGNKRGRGRKNKKNRQSPSGYPSGQSIEDKEETLYSNTDKVDDLDLRTTEVKKADKEQLLAMFSGNPVIARHVDLLKRRRERTQALLISLAKQMFVLSLYLDTETVIVQNGKFGVKLTVGIDDLGVQIFTTGTNAEAIDWRDFISELVQSRSVNSVESAVKSRRQRRRGSENCAVGGYNVNSKGVLLRNDIPREYIPLIPTAKLLVDEQLAEQEEATKAELAYLAELDEMTPEWKSAKPNTICEPDIPCVARLNM